MIYGIGSAELLGALIDLRRGEFRRDNLLRMLVDINSRNDVETPRHVPVRGDVVEVFPA